MMSKIIMRGISVFIPLIIVLAAPFPAAAHGIYIYAWVEGDTVYTESYFSAKKKVNDGVVQVFDVSGKRIVEGRTDEHGEFKFKADRTGDLRIVVDAGSGHRSEYVLKADESSTQIAGTNTPDRNHAVVKGTTPAGLVNTDQLRVLIEQALDDRLRPILRELAEIRGERSPDFTEIIGGIGYVFGIMGLIMYFKALKKR